MKKEYFCDVYVAEIPSADVCLAPLYPESREREVSGIKNERAKREKYFAWRLLETALKKSLDVNIKDLKIKKNTSGKWVAEGIYFSISHAKNAAAVSISSAPVGIDIEPLSSLKNDISGRVLTESELAEYGKLGDAYKREYLIKKWTAKEAIFKSRDEAVFRPEKIEVCEHNASWFETDVRKEKYIIAVSGEVKAKTYFLEI